MNLPTIPALEIHLMKTKVYLIVLMCFIAENRLLHKNNSSQVKQLLRQKCKNIFKLEALSRIVMKIG